LRSVSDAYLIRYDGSGHRTQFRDAWPGLLFVVEQGERHFYFCCAMSRSLGVGFRDLDGDEMEAVMVAAGLDELERRLRAGIYPPDEGDYEEFLFTSDHYDHLEGIRAREKHCLWQETLARGWICRATKPGGDERTTAVLCGGCPVPDERVLCVHFAHPSVDSVGGMGGARTRVVAERPLCNIGKDPGDGDACHLGGLECARRIVDTGIAFPEPPADVARRAADEIDYFELVYRDHYGSRAWTIPQARSISELFGECETAEDFQRRVAALADLLGRLQPHDQLSDEDRVNEQGDRVGSLVALERLMVRDHPEAAQAVRTLRRIPDARNAFPVHTRSEGLIGALKDLGVDFPATDWRLAWQQVLTAFWSSLQEVRVAIQTSGRADDAQQPE
jgi:hypothetical protein